MTNVKNYNFKNLNFNLSYDEYYDFYLNNDAITQNSNDYGDNLMFSFTLPDFNPNDFNPNDFKTGDVTELISGVSWAGATTSSFTASTYGLTGLDNGAIPYTPETGDYAHTGITSVLTGTSLVHVSGDTQLKLKQVSGYTGNYVYPIEIIATTASTGNYLNFCGGFYQAYYKLDGHDYQVLPNRYQKGWTIDTWLNKSDSVCSGTTGATLNDDYSNNAGFFYYIGTRAENKFWNIFTGNTSGDCTSGVTSGFCTTIKETDVNINNITVDGSGTTLSVPLSPPPVDVEQIKNNFLIFGRSEGVLCTNQPSSDGYGQVRAGRNYDRDTIYYSSIVREVTTNYLNPFLIFGRSEGTLCTNQPSSDGYGQVRAGRNFSGMTTPLLELDKDTDLIDNALGFRIKDDGSIGYRLLTLSADCKSVEVIEEYSASGTVSADTWTHVAVKWVNNDTYNDCDLINGKARRGRFKFYVNSMLIFVSQELDELTFKRLDDLSEKQVAVPYNISIGGGSQGLLESITFDGQDADDLGLIIEQNFAGTFIGSISSFNIYDKNLSWCEIKNAYNSNLAKYL
tara:strand:+ start:2171 stop:3868 length:1698 start_codon:yes stop_codon:yes gene_type:complete